MGRGGELLRVEIRPPGGLGHRRGGGEHEFV
jgi:hypothetical protein